MHDVETIKAAVREVLDEKAEHLRSCSPCPLSPDDVVWFHRFKGVIDKLAMGIGMAIILGLAALIGWLLKLGAATWRGGGGTP